MKKVTLCMAALSVLAGCASFKPDYVVRDASENTPPAWLVVPEKAAKEKSELKSHRFYISDAENVNKRLCTQQAEAQATQKVASEIAQNITSAFEAAYKSTDDSATGALKDSLQRGINQNLHGVAIAKEYWEKRQYMTEMGAEEDIVRFKCNAAVKIAVKDLEKAVKDAKAVALKQIKDADQKAAVSTAVDTVLNAVKAAPAADASALLK